MIRIDCTRNDYFVTEDGNLGKSPKGPNKDKTDDTIAQLFQAASAPYSAEQHYALRNFTQALSCHLEQKLSSRYGIFGQLIVLFEKTLTCGTFNKLEQAKALFTRRLEEHKLQAIQALKNSPKEAATLLATLFLLNPDASCGHEATDALYKKINETRLFSPQDAIQLAWHLTHKKLTEAYTPKNPSQNLPRTLFYDAARKTAYIAAKEQIAKTQVKKVVKALSIYNEGEKVGTAAILTTQNSLSEHMKQLTVKEYETAKSFSGKPGFWPVLFSSEYQKGTIGKVTIVAKLGFGDLRHAADKLSFEQLVTVATTLLEGLATMHAEKIVHRDIKDLNALVNKTFTKAGWIDFGLSGKVQDEHIINSFKRGCYGTRKFTAPELFGVQGFSGDLYKTDIWAFGVTLWRTHFKTDPPWFKDFPKELWDKSITYTQKDDYKKAIAALVAEGKKKPATTRQERFEQLIYKLLEPDPALRPTAQEALDFIKTLG